jgi:hypothetical protein
LFLAVVKTLSVRLFDTMESYIPSVAEFASEYDVWESRYKQFKIVRKKAKRIVLKKQVKQEREEMLKTYSCHTLSNYKNFISTTDKLSKEWVHMDVLKHDFCHIGCECKLLLDVYRFKGTMITVCENCFYRINDDIWSSYILYEFYPNYAKIQYEHEKFANVFDAEMKQKIDQCHDWIDDTNYRCVWRDCTDVSVSRFVGTAVALCKNHQHHDVKPLIYQEYIDRFTHDYLFNNDFLGIRPFEMVCYYNRSQLDKYRQGGAQHRTDICVDDIGITRMVKSDVWSLHVVKIKECVKTEDELSVRAQILFGEKNGMKRGDIIDLDITQYTKVKFGGNELYEKVKYIIIEAKPYELN